MEAVDKVNPEVAHLFVAKQARRRALAALSFPEKVKAVVKLQQMAAPLLRARERIVRPWSCSPT
ncbi:MAG: hypothetical protein DLM73_17445 [Chthoniobacterales bacterium]|nr:MAG: hypothetical protein DLM73_17445 [Chthoniobacterales bacterium]